MIDFISFVIDRREEIFLLLIEHIQLTAVSVSIAILIGVPVGILISRYKQIHKPVMGAVNIMQAIPSMAVLGFLIPFLGIGRVPAIFMVVLYSLMPIIKNTATGILNINKETLETAKAIGMTKLQILGRVQFPIALPVIMAGIRISAVTSVGLMTLASFIGAGGLGYLIYSGVQMVNSYMILAGALPACMLALFMDFFFSKIEKAVTPISLRLGSTLPDSKEKLLHLKKKQKIFLSVVASMMSLLILFVAFSSRISEEKVVTITSKTYPEQVLVGNMVADIIEDKTDITVIRKLNMGGTQICFEAIVSGEVDMQVDYTGTMFTSILKQGLSQDAQFIYDTIKSMYSDDYGLAVLDELGFNNTFALAVRQDTSVKFNLETISNVQLFQIN